ncbi:GtrA family protein [Streptococcus sp. DD10]|nr:GtrA family protein [Streptococcus sp. DD10]KXT76496.1 GtrA family protein [Streptococcus sp. DD10]
MTTIVSVVTRILFYALFGNELVATIIANIAGILFAFATNDTIVFKQQRTGWWNRLIKFFTARLGTLFLDLGLTYIFVTSFPQFIGQFVNNDMKMINLVETILAQFFIVFLNYFISKLFIFRNTK